MTLEAWSTIASIGTFVVIATTAIAALMQLRHLRSGNQIAILTSVYETLESDRFTQARNFAYEVLPGLIERPEQLVRLAAPPPLPDEFGPIRLLANFFENVGAFVRNGIIDKRLACDLWGNVVLDTWEQLEVIVALRRRRSGSALWENFEYLAALSKIYTDAHPSGNYPRSVPRMTFSARAMNAAAAIFPDDT